MSKSYLEESDNIKKENTIDIPSGMLKGENKTMKVDISELFKEVLVLRDPIDIQSILKKLSNNNKNGL